MMRPSTSSFFRPEPAEYMRTAWKAATLDGAGADRTALEMATRATGRAAAREATAAVRIRAVRNMVTGLRNSIDGS